ncbi:MAG: dihydrofolate reductase family protein, partial [Anaerolineales bacterium]
MGIVIGGMAISLDGFVEDQEGSTARLYPDMDALHETETLKEQIATTGAVVMGRKTFAMGDPDWYAGNYEFQAPIFVVTHHPPEKTPKQDDKLTFTFVTDGVASAIRQAKAAAGERNVVIVGGASTLRQCLQAGLVDELQMAVAPVVLGGGKALFDAATAEGLRLEKVRVLDELDWTEI